MLKSRTVTLSEDEVLLIRREGSTQDMAQARVLLDTEGEPHAFLQASCFASFHTNLSPDQIKRVLASSTEELTFPTSTIGEQK